MHGKCTSAAKKFKSMAEGKEPTAALLAQLHVCIRHILAHKGMSIDVKKVIDGYTFSDVASTSQYLRCIAQRSPILNSLSSATANATDPSTADSASSSAAEGSLARGTPSSAGTGSFSASASTPVSALMEFSLTSLQCKQHSSWLCQRKSIVYARTSLDNLC